MIRSAVEPVVCSLPQKNAVRELGPIEPVAMAGQTEAIHLTVCRRRTLVPLIVHNPPFRAIDLAWVV
jgi:hypothetical protein